MKKKKLKKILEREREREKKEGKKIERGECGRLHV